MKIIESNAMTMRRRRLSLPPAPKPSEHRRTMCPELDVSKLPTDLWNKIFSCLPNYKMIIFCLTCSTLSSAPSPPFNSQLEYFVAQRKTLKTSASEPMTSRYLYFLPSCRSLTKISFFRTPLPVSVGYDFFSSLPNLKIIWLNYCDHLNHDPVLLRSLLSKLKNLSCIDLTGTVRADPNLIDHRIQIQDTSVFAWSADNLQKYLKNIRVVDIHGFPSTLGGLCFWRRMIGDYRTFLDPSIAFFPFRLLDVTQCASGILGEVWYFWKTMSSLWRDSSPLQAFKRSDLLRIFGGCFSSRSAGEILQDILKRCTKSVVPWLWDVKTIEGLIDTTIEQTKLISAVDEDYDRDLKSLNRKSSFELLTRIMKKILLSKEGVPDLQSIMNDDVFEHLLEINDQGLIDTVLLAFKPKISQRIIMNDQVTQKTLEKVLNYIHESIDNPQVMLYLVVNQMFDLLSLLSRRISPDALKVYFPSHLFKEIKVVRFLFNYGYMPCMMQAEHRKAACSVEEVWSFLKNKVPSHWEWNLKEPKPVEIAPRVEQPQQPPIATQEDYLFITDYQRAFKASLQDFEFETEEDDPELAMALAASLETQ